MKINIILQVLCSSLILYGCISDFNVEGIDETANILVVEGIITDDETVITLSRSLNLTDKNDDTVSYCVDFAKVYVACDDGTSYHADSYYSDDGRYTIRTGRLNPDRSYCLKIEIEESDCSGDGLPCTVKTMEYGTDFSYPIQTPEIDSVFWVKRGGGQPVMIHVATHSPDNSVLYCRWSYKEDWEINSSLSVIGYPFYCWSRAANSDLLLGSSGNTVMGKITDRIAEIDPSDMKFSTLYRIDVTQNAISKRAYDYFANVKKNVRQTGGIFAPIPSEVQGNITCMTDPGRPVIGYVDVSTTTGGRLYISKRDVYEPPFTYICRFLSLSEVCEECGIPEAQCNQFNVQDRYILSEMLYVRVECVDCTYFGTTQKPDDWPD